jgi:hypothetical protein
VALASVSPPPPLNPRLHQLNHIQQKTQKELTPTSINTYKLFPQTKKTLQTTTTTTTPEPQRFLFFTPISETFRAMGAKTETERWGTREVQKEK